MKQDIQSILDAHRTSGIRLDLGCGGNKQPGFVGLDKRPLPGVDVVQDLETFPWCLPDGCAELAVASHVVEHIDPAHGTFLRFMDEAWRVLEPGGKLMLSGPYAGSPGFWQDPTHCNGCTEVTWWYFDPLEPHSGGNLYRIYHPKPWKILANTYALHGNFEVALEKRREDESYAL